MIARTQHRNITEWLGKGKAVIVIGPRQVGKTTLVRRITQNLNLKTLWLTGDDPETRSLLDNVSLARLQNIIGQNEVVVVDEAQRFTNAGLMLKLVTDHLPQVQLFVTGSSSLDLAAQTKESLTGRKIEFHLYPLSFVEMCAEHGYLTERSLLEHRMLYGYYPEVVQNDPPQAQKILNDLSDGLMYKDLLSLDQIKKPSLLVKLLQALALQVGSEVRYLEVAQTIGADQVLFCPGGVVQETGAANFMLIDAERVLNATGAWSIELNRSLGIALPNHPHRHEIMSSEPLKPFLDPLVVDLSTGLYFSQSTRGEIVAGITMEDDGPPATEVDLRSSRRFLSHLGRALCHIMPVASQLRVLRQWAGPYDVSPDGDAIVGPSPGVPRLYQVCGFTGHGFMMAPAVGKLVAELLATGKRHPMLDRWDPARFGRGDTGRREDMIIG